MSEKLIPMQISSIEQNIVDQLSPRDEFISEQGHITEINLAAIPTIDITPLKHIKKLRLANLEITDFPDWIFSFPKLELLDLDLNELTEIPSNISELSSLHTLEISNNFLVEIPFSLTELYNLRKLSMWGNPDLALPSWISQIKSLEILHLDDILLHELDEQILNSLPNLEELDLGRNIIRNIQEINLDLPNLTSLDISDMDLAQLPKWVKKHQRLKYLSLAGNPLLNLDEIDITFPDLDELSLNEMGLSSLPVWIFRHPKLTYLGLANNQIQYLTPKILGLKHLTSLRLDDNPLLAIPQLLLSQIPTPDQGSDNYGLCIDQNRQVEYLPSIETDPEAIFLEDLLQKGMEDYAYPLINQNRVYSRLLWERDQPSWNYPLLSKFLTTHPKTIQIEPFEMLL